MLILSCLFISARLWYSQSTQDTIQEVAQVQLPTHRERVSVSVTTRGMCAESTLCEEVDVCDSSRRADDGDPQEAHAVAERLAKEE